MTSSTETQLYECSGLIISSEVSLPATPLRASKGLDVDLRVILGEEVEPPFIRPSAELVAELIVNHYLFYTICRVGDGYVARLPRIGDFVIDGDLRRVVCHPVASGQKDMVPIIVSGTIAAFVLAMKGKCVLHGSAVDIGGRAVAFVGASGQGKSTMAAIFCAAGASLVTDDVLPLEFGEGASANDVVFCLKSGHEIRLREKASSLAERIGVGAVRMTPDERHAVAPETSPLKLVPLSAIVLPRPSSEHVDVVARRLPDGEASLALGRCQRIEGWREPEQLRRQFTDIGRVVGSVPVFAVSVPWGPPFGEDLAARVLDACGVDSPLLTSEGISSPTLGLLSG